jgi:tyrosyl-tRNA synthetase
MKILDELEWRGLLADCTDTEALKTRLTTGPVTLYCGFDPTADSLHVGHLVPLLALRRFQLDGHHPIAVAGGATGSIGDPSGKSQERSLLTKDEIAANIDAVRPQLGRWLDFGSTSNPARLVDNADWTAPISYLDFLRDIGKYFSVNQMVGKESVRARMEDRDVGISYTEFSYMLLQSFDYYHLAREMNCELQIGGSDQWGNITAGMDLIRKKLGRSVFGLTLPLITKSDGTKFGKTAGGAIWLDPAKTSIYRFYQFWIQTDDRDVVRYLKFFTFLSRTDIDALAAQHTDNPAGRVAHKALAQAVTEMIHGAGAAQEAQRASEILFGGGLDGVERATFLEIAGEVPSEVVSVAGLDGDGYPVFEAFVASKLCSSKGQARKDWESGGLYINNERWPTDQRWVRRDHLLFDRYLLLRKGKRNYAVLEFAEDTIQP